MCHTLVAQVVVGVVGELRRVVGELREAEVRYREEGRREVAKFRQHRLGGFQPNWKVPSIYPGPSAST